VFTQDEGVVVGADPENGRALQKVKGHFFRATRNAPPEADRLQGTEVVGDGA